MFKILQTVTLVVPLSFLPVMVSLLFNAGAEAFFGVKEPMLETAAAFGIHKSDRHGRFDFEPVCVSEA